MSSSDEDEARSSSGDPESREAAQALMEMHNMTVNPEPSNDSPPYEPPSPPSLPTRPPPDLFQFNFSNFLQFDCPALPTPAAQESNLRSTLTQEAASNSSASPSSADTGTDAYDPSQKHKNYPPSNPPRGIKRKRPSSTATVPPVATFSGVPAENKDKTQTEHTNTPCLAQQQDGGVLEGHAEPKDHPDLAELEARIRRLLEEKSEMASKLNNLTGQVQDQRMEINQFNSQLYQSEIELHRLQNELDQSNETCKILAKERNESEELRIHNENVLSSNVESLKAELASSELRLEAKTKDYSLLRGDYNSLQIEYDKIKGYNEQLNVTCKKIEHDRSLLTSLYKIASADAERNYRSRLLSEQFTDKRTKDIVVALLQWFVIRERELKAGISTQRATGDPTITNDNTNNPIVAENMDGISAQMGTDSSLSKVESFIQEFNAPPSDGQDVMDIDHTEHKSATVIKEISELFTDAVAEQSSDEACRNIAQVIYKSFKLPPTLTNRPRRLPRHYLPARKRKFLKKISQKLPQSSSYMNGYAADEGSVGPPRVVADLAHNMEMADCDEIIPNTFNSAQSLMPDEFILESGQVPGGPMALFGVQAGQEVPIDDQLSELTSQFLSIHDDAPNQLQVALPVGDSTNYPTDGRCFVCKQLLRPMSEAMPAAAQEDQTALILTNTGAPIPLLGRSFMNRLLEAESGTGPAGFGEVSNNTFLDAIEYSEPLRFATVADMAEAETEAAKIFDNLFDDPVIQPQQSLECSGVIDLVSVEPRRSELIEHAKKQFLDLLKRNRPRRLSVGTTTDPVQKKAPLVFSGLIEVAATEVEQASVSAKFDEAMLALLARASMPTEIKSSTPLAAEYRPLFDSGAPVPNVVSARISDAILQSLENSSNSFASAFSNNVQSPLKSDLVETTPPPTVIYTPAGEDDQPRVCQQIVKIDALVGPTTNPLATSVPALNIQEIFRTKVLGLFSSSPVEVVEEQNKDAELVPFIKPKRVPQPNLAHARYQKDPVAYYQAMAKFHAHRVSSGEASAANTPNMVLGETAAVHPMDPRVEPPAGSNLSQTSWPTWVLLAMTVLFGALVFLLSVLLFGVIDGQCTSMFNIGEFHVKVDAVRFISRWAQWLIDEDALQNIQSLGDSVMPAMRAGCSVYPDYGKMAYGYFPS